MNRSTFRACRHLVAAALAGAGLLCSAAAQAQTFSDLMAPELSGLSPADLATWFNDTAKSPMTTSGEQVAFIWQNCTNCQASIDQTGGDNYLMIFQEGYGSIAMIAQEGNNHLAIFQTGSEPGVVVARQSAGNAASVAQSGGARSSWR